MRRAKDDWDVFNFKRIDLILPTQLAEIAMCYLKKKKKDYLNTLASGQTYCVKNLFYKW